MGDGHRMESPMIQAIFYAEFDVHRGPVIVYQTPHNFMPEEVFKNISEYVITKKMNAYKLTSVRVGKHTVMGFPICLESTKYDRNVCLFNVCFVVDSRVESEKLWDRVIRKIGYTLKVVELESEFIYHQNSKDRLRVIIADMYRKLNAYGQCSVALDEANTLHLKVNVNLPEPPEIMLHQVPVPCIAELVSSLMFTESDLCLRAILPHINGVNSVFRISQLARVELWMVCVAVRHLYYYRLVTLVDVFQYGNEYRVLREGLQALFIKYEHEKNSAQMSKMLSYVGVVSKPPPSVEEVIALYCMFPGKTAGQLDTYVQTRGINVTTRRLVAFGVINGILKRIHTYVVLRDPSKPLEGARLCSLPAKVQQMVKEGSHCYDEYCSILLMPRTAVDNLFAKCPEICLIRR